MKRVTIKIRKGKIEWDFDGYVGVACLIEAERIKQLLREKYGVEVEDEYVQIKPEAFEDVEEHEEVRQGW